MAEQVRLPNEGTIAGVEIHGAEAGHVVPVRVLLGVWAILVVLTVATVAVTRVDFGPGTNLWIAMGIATVKASLVLLYFMHLRYDQPDQRDRVLYLRPVLRGPVHRRDLDRQPQHQYQADLIRGYAPEMTTP